MLRFLGTMRLALNPDPHIWDRFISVTKDYIHSCEVTIFIAEGICAERL